MLGIAAHSSRSKTITSFHIFLDWLQIRKTLLRVYTQNIDGLELQAGLVKQELKNKSPSRGTCVQLHGTVHELRCNMCSIIFPTLLWIDVLSQNRHPECVRCLETSKARHKENARPTSSLLAWLRFNVVLYDEEHSDSVVDYIIKKDVHSAVDVILVVGTTLAIASAANLVKALLDPNSRRKPRPPPTLVFVDILGENALTKAKRNLLSPVSYWVTGDCQDFAKAVMEKDGSNPSISPLPRNDFRTISNWS